MNQVEFQEIGHCGGKITFHVVTDADGHQNYQIGYSHSSPTPAGFFAVYAIPQGVAVDTIQLGGIGTPWNPPPIPGCYPVLIASDSEGMYGHQCPRCSGYWRCHGGAGTCPYCGLRAKSHQFLTQAQQQYVVQYCDALSEALDKEGDIEHVVDMDAVADAVGSTTEKPPFYYAEESQQNKFTCNACGEINDILGRYGYCSVCGTRNDLQELEKAINSLRDRINSVGPYETCAKEAVSTFDSFAAQYAKQLVQRIPMTPARKGRIEKMHFHNLDKIVEQFRTIFDIDLLSGMNKEDIEFSAKMFHRRHVYEHKGGEADDKYIADSGDTSVRPKQALHETQESAHRIANLVVKIATNLHRGFHEIFPPLAEPIRWHSERMSPSKAQ